MPTIATVPIGVSATREFVSEACDVLGLPQPAAEPDRVRMPWYSRSVDSTYLTGKRVFVFGDGTHACAAARFAEEEMGFKVVGLGTYAREQARSVRAAAKGLGLTPLITDDYLEVERAIEEAAPELVLGTQMERHIAKRLGIPCALICAPFHVQDCPARYSPIMGWEGANVLFDTWVHPLMMGLEEHLLAMFRDDPEFSDSAPSHLGHHSPRRAAEPAETDLPVAKAPTVDALPEPLIDTVAEAAATGAELIWTDEALRELKKIPFFVRKRARNNTERYARDHGLTDVRVDTLYDAKAHFSG